MNRSFRIEYPASLPDAVHQTPEEFEQEARYAMAVKLFEMKRISSGQAAQFTGTDRATFLLGLSRSGVAMIDLPGEDVENDICNAGLL
jgi:predicted HTH domain antitoxin